VRLNPTRAPILKPVSCAVEGLFHRCGNPELNSPADEGSVEALRRDANNGVRNIPQSLCLSDDLWVPFAAIAPELIAEDDQRMRIAADILAWLETAPQDGTYTDGVEIVGRDNAAGRDLSVVSHVERAAGDRSNESVVAQCAVAAEIEEVGPGKEIAV